MVDPRAYGNRTVPGNPPGRQVFTATNCSFYVDHRAIQCSYGAWCCWVAENCCVQKGIVATYCRFRCCVLIAAPGAGRKLSFEVMVDGQASASPTTTYLPPSISDVALLDGATAASTRGGTRIRIRGLNFGTPDLIQAVRYGRNGREYLVDSFVYVDHTEIIATIGASRARPTARCTMRLCAPAELHLKLALLRGDRVQVPASATSCRSPSRSPIRSPTSRRRHSRTPCRASWRWCPTTTSRTATLSAPRLLPCRAMTSVCWMRP